MNGNFRYWHLAGVGEHPMTDHCWEHSGLENRRELLFMLVTQAPISGKLRSTTLFATDEVNANGQGARR
jgi:hypothetical protein